jgi:hypothetical protein
LSPAALCLGGSLVLEARFFLFLLLTSFILAASAMLVLYLPLLSSAIVLWRQSALRLLISPAIFGILCSASLFLLLFFMLAPPTGCIVDVLMTVII